MKNIIVGIAAMSSIAVNANAQVTFEQSYTTRAFGAGQEMFLTNLGNNDYKYVLYDYHYSTFSLYNLNHTPFMLNVQIPIMSDSVNNIYYRLGYITKSLFDCDSTNIEYAMMLNYPTPSKSPNFAVYRTDGSVIFSKDTVGTVFCVGCGSGSYITTPIMQTPAGAKLWLFSNPIPGYEKRFIYSLCGELPINISEVNQSESFVKVCPNPSEGETLFKIISPNHSERYELNIFNASFQVVKTTSITGGDMQLNIDNSALSPGTYFYSLQNKDKVFQTGKFVLSK